MSSDDYFDDELDSAFLNEVEAIEAAHSSSIPSARTTGQQRPPTRNPAPPPPPPPPPPQVINIDDSEDDFDISGINEDALQVFDRVCAAQNAQTSTSTSKPTSRKSSMGTVQMNLFGQIVSNDASSSKAGSSSRKPISRSNSSARNLFGSRSKKTKQWDHAAFAKNGWKKPKGKGKASFDGDEEEEEEELDDPVEFEQFPAPSEAIS